MSSIFKTLEVNFNNWRLYLIMGMVFLITGIWGLFEHISVSVAFIIFLCVAFLVSGLLKIGFSLLDKDGIDNWRGSVANGVIVLILGTLLIFLNPSVAALAIIVGVLMLRYAYNSINHTFDMKKYENTNWIGLAAFGFMGIAFALLLIFYPLIGRLTRVFYASMTFLSLGVFNIVYAFQLKKLKDKGA